MKKLATWKILLIFTFSPFCTGMLYGLFTLLNEGILFESKLDLFNFLDMFIGGILFLGAMAFAYFFISAFLTGLIYLFLNNIKRLKQEIICSIMGFFFSSIWALPGLFSGERIEGNPIAVLFVFITPILGLITAFVVSFLLNRYQKKPYHKKAKEVSKN